MEKRSRLSEFCQALSARVRSVDIMTAQAYIAPDDDEPDEAEIEATLADYREWVAAECPGEMSHEEATAELLAQ